MKTNFGQCLFGGKEDCFQRKQGEHGRGVLSIVPEMQQELSAYCYMNTYC